MAEVPIVWRDVNAVYAASRSLVGTNGVHVDGVGAAGLVLTLRDYGLMARMARTISPDPHAASMLLKASANSLCQGDDEKGRQTCERIADFVDAPGSLTLKRRADVPPASMVELALNVLSARLGYLFEAEVTQGGASLTTQTEKIYGLGR